MNIGTAASFGLEFESLVHEILTAAGYRIKPTLLDVGFDIHGVDPSDRKVGIDVKFFRTRRPERSELKRVLLSLADKALKAGKDIAILAINETVSVKDSTDLPISAEIIDAGKLRGMASGKPHLVQRLDDLIRVSRLEAIDMPKVPVPSDRIEHGDDRSRLDDLIARHQACSQSDGKAYELIGAEIIAELFGGELGVLHQQHQVADGFHVLDMIASIKPSQPDNFWAHLRSDFRSRYIVFEFKNYSGEISQDQIYSTEKYLFIHALRTVAIVIARNGEAPSARHAREGALREHGKLIIPLSGADLTKMLEMKRDNDDFTSVLADNLDQMLTTLGR